MRRVGVADLQVRRHVSLDDPFVARLSKAAFALYAHDPVGVVSAMIDDAHATFIATLDGVAAGFAVLRLERRRAYGPLESPAIGHLDAIAVAPRLRKRGVGLALLDHVEQIALADGAMAMFLLTATRNRPARSLFEAAGYQYLAGCAAAYLGRHPGVFMTRPLPGG